MALSLKTEQKQTISHKMIQSGEILQMASQELENYLNEQLLENPVLEVSEKKPEDLEKKELEKYQWICAHDEQNRYLYSKLEADDDEPPEWNVDVSGDESLGEYLWSQLLTGEYSAEEENILHFLIDSLDSKGYFTDSLEEVARRFEVEEKEAEKMLEQIQKLEPAGVGARNLQECLCLQLEAEGELTPKLREFIENHLMEMAKNQLPAAAKETGVPLEQIKEFCAIIRELNPKPGAQFSDVRQLAYVVPDVVVVKFKGHIDVLLNESLYPDISLNSQYVRMCTEQDDKELRHYLLDKIHQAEWLKQCIAQRNTTLFSVVKSILCWQEDFFQYGVDFLKPMRLIDIAEELGIHESTVSRAVSQKYLQCSWGVFPLQYFFAKTAVSAQSGEQSATAFDVKRALKAVIDGENKRKPYSDRILAELLTEQNYNISRRTVAKYRDELGIPGTTGRKQY